MPLRNGFDSPRKDGSLALCFSEVLSDADVVAALVRSSIVSAGVLVVSEALTDGDNAALSQRL